MTIFYICFNILAFAFLAPLVQGVIKKVKAYLQMRQGPPVLQMYADLNKYWHKESIVSKNASVVFLFAPYIVFTVITVVALLIPSFNGVAPLASWGDFILVLYLFALARFFLALAGLDAGSAFGGMGSSREMLFSSLVEPAFFVTLLGLALRTHSMNLAAVSYGLSKFGLGVLTPGHVFALVAALIILVAETGRIPVDNPDTHLELTMVHEAMILEYSGKELALMHWSASIKQLILLSLIANLFLPWGIALSGIMGFLVGTIVFLIKIFVLAILLAFIETALVKFRVFKVPDLLAMSFLLAILAILAQYYL
jgi:formate hydrogenlyase subunit 4